MASPIEQRSLMSRLFGNFFERRGNITAIICLMCVGSICYLTTVRDYKDVPEILKSITLATVGFYLGSKVKED